MNITQHKKAMKYLREKGLLKEFANNVNLSSYSRGCFEEYVEITEDYDLINSAFDWSNTKQGHEYWSILHQEWQSYRRCD